jgi:hypothetical protein
MEQYFDETKGDLKYILEEQRRKEMGGMLPDDSKPKKKNRYNRFFKWLKHLVITNKVKSAITKDGQAVCYILCFITS